MTQRRHVDAQQSFAESANEDLVSSRGTCRSRLLGVAHDVDQDVERLVGVLHGAFGEPPELLLLRLARHDVDRTLGATGAFACTTTASAFAPRAEISKRAKNLSGC